MNKYIEDELKELIRKVVSNQPKLMKTNINHSIRFYLLEMKRAFVSVSEQSIRESLFLFNEGKMYEDKPIVYFIAIVRNKNNELNRLKHKEVKRIGSLPNNIV